MVASTYFVKVIVEKKEKSKLWLLLLLPWYSTTSRMVLIRSCLLWVLQSGYFFGVYLWVHCLTVHIKNIRFYHNVLMIYLFYIDALGKLVLINNENFNYPTGDAF